MAQIGQLIADLDSTAKMKQQVYIFNAQNSDTAAMEQLLAGLFPASGTANATARSGTSQQNAPGNQLSNRASQRQTQSTSRSSGGMNNSTSLGGTGR